MSQKSIYRFLMSLRTSHASITDKRLELPTTLAQLVQTRAGSFQILERRCHGYPLQGRNGRAGMGTVATLAFSCCYYEAPVPRLWKKELLSRSLVEGERFWSEDFYSHQVTADSQQSSWWLKKWQVRHGNSTQQQIFPDIQLVGIGWALISRSHIPNYSALINKKNINQ